MTRHQTLLARNLNNTTTNNSSLGNGTALGMSSVLLNKVNTFLDNFLGKEVKPLSPLTRLVHLPHALFCGAILLPFARINRRFWLE
jgi:hypothetical protein